MIAALVIASAYDGTLYMNMPNAGLEDSDELLCLLKYLADTVHHYKPSHFSRSDGKSAQPPRTTSSDRWHCSRVSEWQRMPVDSTQLPRLRRMLYLD